MVPSIKWHEHIIEEYDWVLIPDYAYYENWHEFRRYIDGGQIVWQTKVGPEWLEINTAAAACAELESMFQHWLMAQHMPKKVEV